MRSDYAVELHLDLKYVAQPDRDGRKQKERTETVLQKPKSKCVLYSPMQFFKLISIRSLYQHVEQCKNIAFAFRHSNTGMIN